MDKERKVVEPSLIDRWMGGRKHETNSGGSLHKKTWSFGILIGIGFILAALFKWFFRHVLGVMALGGIVFVIYAMFQGSADLETTNKMWDEHEFMRPSIKEALEDGKITRWESMGLSGEKNRRLREMKEAAAIKILEEKARQ